MVRTVRRESRPCVVQLLPPKPLGRLRRLARPRGYRSGGRKRRAIIFRHVTAFAKRSSTMLMGRILRRAQEIHHRRRKVRAPGRTSKTSDDDMKQECVQWHSFALIERALRVGAGENQSLPKS